MIIPVRCISCGRPISGKWEKYMDEVAKGKNPRKVLDELGVKSYCCRSLFLTHVELIDDIGTFKGRLVPKGDEVVEAEIRVIAPPVGEAPEAEEAAEAAEEPEADEEEAAAEAPKAEKKKK